MRRVLPAVLTTLLTAGLLAASLPAHAAPAAQPAGPASVFVPLSPVRVLDTRTGPAVGPGGMAGLDLTAQVPINATAVVLNVTGVTPTASTHVTVFENGLPRPTASNLNLAAGDIRANLVTVAVGLGRSLNLYNNSGHIHLVADLAGYYIPGTGAKFTPLPPGRVLDTRTTTPVGAGVTRVVDLTGRVPESATAVTFNLTATNVTASTFVTAWPAGATRPTASNLNVVAGDTRPNLVTVPVGVDRKVSLYNNAGQLDLLVDLAGFYTPDYGAHFYPYQPTRVLDTRDGTGTGGSTNPAPPGGGPALDLGDGVPLTTTGVLLNITGVDATAATYVTAAAQAGVTPDASTLNLSAGQTVANAAVVAFWTDRGFGLYNHAGNVHLVVDLAGAFAVVDPTPCTRDCVYAWGDNTARSLGTGQAVYGSPVPTRVVGLSDVSAVAAGNSTAYALREDGTVWSWGVNSYGQLGDGWTTGATGYTGSAAPVRVRGLTGVTAIASTGDSAYALRSNGTVWSWGANFDGLLGNGTQDNSSVPVQVSGLTDVVAIAGSPTGMATYALRSDGTVWAWGVNYGALGNGTYTERSTVPVQVSGLTGVTAIAGGSGGGYAVRTDGTVWSWGANYNGQLGNGGTCVPNSPCVELAPVQVTGLTGVTAVAGGLESAYALRANGTVWSWGANYNGQLGNGGELCSSPETCVSRVPVQASGITDATHVTSSGSAAHVRRANGTVWGWGANWGWQLANDSVSGGTASPVPAQGLPAGAAAVSGGWTSVYALVPA